MAGPGAPARLRELARAWDVRLERVIETATSLVGFGSRAERRVVLKVVSGRHEEWDAGAVAAAFAGRGMVRVHEHVPGAALLEELRPATPLAELVEAGRDDEATSILADIVAAMLEVTPATAGHATAADQRADFDRYLASGDNGIATALVEEARERWAVLCRTQTSVRLLHGDLQHHNILRDAERGWVAIDPKGVVAEIELELAPALRNPIGMPELYTSAAIERRVSRLADVLCVDPGRVVAWTFAQAVLSAIWTIEDGGAVDPDGPALSVARAARELLLR